MAPNDDPLTLALLRGFLLGMAVTQQAHSIERKGRAEYDVLREVADGRLTLVATPEEFAEKLRGLPPQVQERYEQRQHALRLVERADARTVLSQMPAAT